MSYEADQIKKNLSRSIRPLRNQLNKILRTLNSAHQRAEDIYKGGHLDGGKMRNLDNALTWLKDVRGELSEFLKA
jgi:hypothetical protein